VDVYAMGVLFWEMYHGCRAWGGMTQTQIIHAVSICMQRLTFARVGGLPLETTAFIAMTELCLSRVPEERPTAQHIADELIRLYGSLCSSKASQTYEAFC